MSALDKFYDFTLNLPDAKLTSKAMSLCNIDRNVFNIYLTLQEGKNNPILNADLGNYTVTMIVVKPKTKEYVEKVGVVDGSNDRLLFELGDTFNDQIGSYKGEIKVQNGNEVITSSSFAYTVTQSLISGLNAEIEASPDVEILRQLINEVKAVVGMTPGDPDSLLTDYQKKNDNTLITTDKTIIGAINENSLQIKDIANKFTTEQTDNNFILKYGDKIIATIPINGTLVNYGSIVISCNEILEINEGETLDIEVYLSSKPTNNQSIVITTSNSNITTSVSELTFTPNNYATSQIITLTAIHDVSSFDDKNCLVTFASENVENITITVTIKNTDVQQSHYITDGLSLYYDFTETPTNPTTVYDKINNLSIYNSGYTSDSYTDNGVYLVNGGGANAFKMGSSSVSYSAYQTMPEFDDFLNKLKEGNGLTVEYFGQYIPTYVLYAYNTGLELSGTGSVSGGYLANFVSTGSATLMYLNTSDESTNIKLNQVNSVTKDGSTITAFSADNKADTYIHLVITGDESGTLTWYLNGNPMTNTTTASDFKAWDYDTMFKSSYIMVNRAGTEDTNRLIYPATSIKIYNRALSQEEIQTNLEYEVSRTNFIESASVTP